MINSFWNICSTCPMPKEEKLNSEYKRNYVWHPQYRPLAQDVISCAPQSVIKEVGIQRRKQYPDLAYRSHEVIRHDLGQSLKDATDSRARSEERDLTLASKSGPRSRSADPGIHQQHKSIMVQSFPPITAGRVSILPKTEEFPNISEQPSETSEYQSQFAWPIKSDEETPCMTRKSVSMSVIKSSEDAVDSSVPKSKLAPVHRPCIKHKEAISSEKPALDAKKKVKTEYKAKYKPFTSYVYVDGEWKKTSRLLKVAEKAEDHVEPWFVEVTERLQKANEYRWRGHGHPVYGEAFPEMYKQPPEIPAQRPKRLPSELKSNQPKCHQTTSKKGETKKKDSHSESTAEKKLEKEPKKQVLRRPKSAEPAKAKETVKYKRPATTPPAKSTTQSLPSRKRMPKVEEIDKTSKAKPGRRLKEDNAKPSSAIKKAPSSTSQSSGGKVWLQAGPSVSDSAGKDDLPVKEHSDAVRPSSLSPISSAVVSQLEAAQVCNDVEADNSKEPKEQTTHVPHSSVVPLTHVRTPEEVTGVKSPDPENWTVPIENSERLQWSGVNTTDTLSKIKTPEEVTEKLSKVALTDEPVPAVAEPQDSSSTSSSGKLTSANVLDRARSRLDQFWGKNK